MGSQQKEMYDGQFNSILNFRDVGKTINDFLGRKYVPLKTCQALKTDFHIQDLSKKDEYIAPQG